MYRAVNMGTGWIAVKVRPAHDFENIVDYVDNGIPVILANNIQQISNILGEPVEFSSSTEEYDLESALEDFIERFRIENFEIASYEFSKQINSHKRLTAKE